MVYSPFRLYCSVLLIFRCDGFPELVIFWRLRPAEGCQYLLLFCLLNCKGCLCQCDAACVEAAENVYLYVWPVQRMLWRNLNVYATLVLLWFDATKFWSKFNFNTVCIRACRLIFKLADTPTWLSSIYFFFNNENSSVIYFSTTLIFYIKLLISRMLI